MIQHASESSMLSLTDAQGKIIQAMIDYDAQKFGEVRYGFTSYKISKLGINRRTFEINVEKLLENNFLYLIRSVQHGGEISPRKYYQVTNLGFIAYQKWVFDHKKKTGMITRRFFPLITEHWKSLDTLYGNIMIDILKQTTNQIDVISKFLIHHKETKKKILSRKLVEVLTLNIGTIDIILYRDLGETEVVKPRKRKITQRFDQTTNTEINKAVRDRFTFAFYFNLINFGYDTGKMLEYVLTNKPPFYSKGKKIYFKNIDTVAKSAKTFQNKMEKNSNSVIKIINNDPKLYRLFKQTLDEVYSKLNQRKIIKLLKERIR